MEKESLNVVDCLTHARRGGLYSFLGWGTFQADTTEHPDYSTMGVYLSEDGLLCVRPVDEVLDGRFATLEEKAPNPLLDLLDQIDSADDEARKDLIAKARQIASRSVVLDDNALLSGKDAFDIAKARRANA